MNREEAKHLSDVLKAYSEGKELEIKSICFEDNYTTAPLDLDLSNLSLKAAADRLRVKKEPKLRPYKNCEEFLQAQKEHGPYLLWKIGSGYNLYIPKHITHTFISFGDNSKKHDWENVYREFTWQDGTSCGVIE